MPLIALIPIAINILTLVAWVGLLLSTRHLWGGLTGRTLAVFVLANIVQVGLSLLLQGADPLGLSFTVRVFVATLSMDSFALALLTAFILVVVAAGLLGELWSILLRAGMVLWLLMQLPLWRGAMYDVGGVIPERMLLDLARPVTQFTVILLVGYMLMTVGVVLHFRLQITPRWLVPGLLLLISGYLASLVWPALWVLSIPNWLAIPAMLVMARGVRQSLGQARFTH